MKIKTVSYSQSRESLYGYGLKKWDKVGLEIELEEGDTPDKAYTLAHEFVNEKISQNIDNQNEMRGTITRDVVDSPESAMESIKRDISTCTELKVLESYKLIIRNNPELQGTYDEQFKKLSQ